jgi:hypothetical protein
MVRFRAEAELCWTETSATGSAVQRTEALGRDVIRRFEPMIPLLRSQKLGIMAARITEITWRYTLVDEQTEYVASLITTRHRRRTRTVRFSPCT